MQARTEQSGAALNIERLVLTTLMIFAFALFWNSLVHGIILRDAQFALQGIIRPAAERNFWLSLTLALALALVFTLSFARCAPGAVSATVSSMERYSRSWPVFWSILTSIWFIRSRPLWPGNGWYPVCWNFWLMD